MFSHIPKTPRATAPMDRPIIFVLSCSSSLKLAAIELKPETQHLVYSI